MKKIVVATDSFKGCLTSSEVALAVEKGIKAVYPDCNVVRFPIADGGEGILDVLVEVWQGTTISVMAHDPLMKEIDTHYGISGDGKTALIEMASVSGLLLVPADQRNPLITTTFGTGELIKDALRRGCRNFIIGIGGSATNDAGLGMLQALGFRFTDRHGTILGVGGEMLERVASVDLSAVLPELKEARFTVACDVDSLFYGPNGSASIFAPQKGADIAMVKRLDAGMRSIARVICRTTGKDIASVKGAGAAGGLGGALYAFMDATLVMGIKLLLDALDFERHIEGANLIITGEGKMDRQTLMGKVAYGILKEAQKYRVPVIAIAGKVEDKELLKEAGFGEIYAVTPEGISLEQAMDSAYSENNIVTTIRSVLFRVCL